jgi:pimeloyl-ACP methyl ester carboxylesterase
MEGAVTDGVTRLLLRLSLDKADSVTFTLEGSGDPSEDGTLKKIDSDQTTNTITVNSNSVDDKDYAFAIYQAPKIFPRAGHSEDLNTAERKISVKVTADGIDITKDIKLVRPPVLLVHGLWSTPAKWYENDFYPKLLNAFPKIGIVVVDYSATNASYLDLNRKVIPNAITEAKRIYSLKNIAITQVDIVAHSMGGLLARQWAEGADRIYKRDNNFWQGDIDKLITLDTPHKGSFLADAGIACSKGPHSNKATALFATMEASGRSLTQGAVEDQMSKSIAITNINSNSTQAPVHAIVGHYTDYSIQSYINPDGTIWHQISGLPIDYNIIHNILESDANTYNRLDYQTIPYIVNGSDLVVSTDSQQGGLNLPAYYTWGHYHGNVTTDEILNDIIDLLNTLKDRNVFSKGF